VKADPSRAEPAAQLVAAHAEPSADSPLERLLQQVQAGADFPALSARVVAILRMSASEHEPLHRVADEVLQDIALTQRLLRLVNTAHFKRRGQDVGTISRAVALVGMAGIRNLALSLVLLEHMHDQAHALRLKQAFARALLAGQLANDLARTRQEAEEAFLAALFSNLGGLVAEFYFPAESESIRQRAALLDPKLSTPCHNQGPLEQAAREVLGVGFDELGAAVGKLWNLPAGLQKAMRYADGPSPAHHLRGTEEYERWLAIASNEAATALWAHPADDAPWHLDHVVQRHGRALGINSQQMLQAARQAERTLADMARNLGLALPSRVKAADQPSVRTQPPAQTVAQSPGQTGSTAIPRITASQAPEATTASAQALSVLSSGIQDAAQALGGEGAVLQPVLHIVLETIYRALDSRRVVFFLREAGQARLIGRLGLGLSGASVLAQIQIPLGKPSGGQPDALTKACSSGEDLWVPDFAADAGPWPDWVTKGGAPGALLALPIHVRGRPLGLVLAERAQAMTLGDTERALLRTLRSQIVQAFRQTA
jgi:HD-like signal output (HDOD) protein